MFGLKRLGRRTALAAALAMTVTGGSALALDAAADTTLQKEDRETFLLPSDRLAVTLGTPVGASSGSDDYAIWVGEVELNGRTAVWVELIDEHGEVIYDSEVAHNETHLLPNGRAVVVRALLDDSQGATQTVAKTDESRVAPDARLVVTRRVVDAPSVQTAIEFIEQTPTEEPSAMERIASFGERIWSAIVASFTAATDGVRVAWTWLTEPFRA
ncbi:hypothetical protein LC092_02115 [Stappia stellulata]|uniref:hypothetical protein n=2 Tax=Stappia TaxID=152161 RepID=UPI001CD49894|nr:hypothetical protein [Stappia stellulata]MCA1241225.1 hypothetical protein [Stappia stellulata]